MQLGQEAGRIQDKMDPPLSLLSLAGSVSKEDNSTDASSSMPPIKDSSPSLLNLEKLKAAAPPSRRAQPKSDASPERIRPLVHTKPYAQLTLTKEERAPVFAATKLANPDADKMPLTWHSELLYGKQTA